MWDAYNLRMKYKVLVVATSHKTRGGITSVVKAHKQGIQWNAFHCRWIETHIDKSRLFALFYFLKSLVSYSYYLFSAQLVHIHLSEPGSAIRKMFFFIPALLLRKKIIIHFHSYSVETTINGKYKNVYQFIFSHADVVIVLSKYWKEAVEDAFNLNNVKVIYNPCTTQKNDKYYLKENIILYAGTVNSRKGYLDLIKAFSLISAKYPEWKIVFAGNGEIENGQKIAKELHIADKVEFLGWVNGEAKDEAFKKASIFCLPSYAEGFPMAILDAWAYGLPVITTPVGGITDVAIDGGNMLIFSPGNIHELAQKISILIDDKELRNKITVASETFADTIFNMKEINAQINNLYSELLIKTTD